MRKNLATTYLKPDPNNLDKCNIKSKKGCKHDLATWTHEEPEASCIGMIGAQSILQRRGSEHPATKGL